MIACEAYYTDQRHIDQPGRIGMTATGHQTKGTFDLVGTYVQLADGPAAVAVEVDDDFWDKIETRPELHGGRLVGVFHNAADWSVWEMHPEGDEVVCLLSGSVEVVLEEGDGERVVPMRAGNTCIVPRGVWHTANVHTAGDTLHITRGAGTRHRPR
jgi:mannose-6-phosphate isomerase-like protein (cupin superfamily)